MEFKRAECQSTAAIATINANTMKKLKWVTFRKQFFLYLHRRANMPFCCGLCKQPEKTMKAIEIPITYLLAAC